MNAICFNESHPSRASYPSRDCLALPSSSLVRFGGREAGSACWSSLLGSIPTISLQIAPLISVEGGRVRKAAALFDPCVWKGGKRDIRSPDFHSKLPRRQFVSLESSSFCCIILTRNCHARTHAQTIRTKHPHIHAHKHDTNTHTNTIQRHLIKSTPGAPTLLRYLRHLLPSVSSTSLSADRYLALSRPIRAS